MRPFGRNIGRKRFPGISVIPQLCSLSSSSGGGSSSNSSASLPKTKQQPRYRNMSAEGNNYQSWTKNGLIQKVKELEHELRHRPAPAPVPEAAPQQKNEHDGQDATTAEGGVKPKKQKGKRKMDPSKYSTRYIALKLAYLGKNYGGYEFQAMATLPSIEEELWNALTRACLIFPKDERVVDFDCCEYSKCGRTDRGVSAFGQVIGLRVRSNRPLPKKRRKVSQEGEGGGDAMVIDQPRPDEDEETESSPSFDPILDEIHYPRVLNRLLPPDIRILAWCPSPPPGFSARFSCRERQYRYFFTQPAFTPDPSNSGGESGLRPGWLDIEAMRDAAKRYEGDNDFRNLCKIDPAKQITNFRRTIYEADIEEVKDVSSALPYLAQPNVAPTASQLDTEKDAKHPKVYCFKVRGSAFLWHQIRHMVALLFLVGQRLEAPSVISELLDVATNPRKPNYVMADEVPLVLWDCLFPGDDGKPSPDALRWIYLSEDPALNMSGQFGVMDGMWAVWRERKMDELLANQLLQHISQQGDPSKRLQRKETAATTNASTIVYEGGNSGRMGGRYIPIMKKDLLQSAEEQNDRYAKRKGFADAEDMRRQKGFRSSAKVDENAVE